MPTTIGWTDETWNPGIAGCSDKSHGCTHCYAKIMAHRLAGMPATKEKYAGTTKRTAGGKIQWTGKINLNPEDPAFFLPLRWNRPRMVFVNSMTDLFHEDVPFEFVDRVMAIICLSERHTFQVLTKRPDRMLEYFNRKHTAFPNKKAGKESLSIFWQNAADSMGIHDAEKQWAWPSLAVAVRVEKEWPLNNLWLLTSIEDQRSANERIPYIIKVPAVVRGISAEPLVGPVDLLRIGFDPVIASTAPGYLNWVIAGGESGNDARPVHPDWVRGLRDQCKSAGVPFFFKQWGEWAVDSPVSANGPFLHGFLFKTKPREFRCMLPDGYSEKYYDMQNVSDEAINEPNTIKKDTPHAWWMAKVGKKASGNMLDGEIWEEFPDTNVRGALPDARGISPLQGSTNNLKL